jgi:hypothetical protein
MGMLVLSDVHEALAPSPWTGYQGARCFGGGMMTMMMMEEEKGPQASEGILVERGPQCNCDQSTQDHSPKLACYIIQYSARFNKNMSTSELSNNHYYMMSGAYLS